MPSLPDTLRGCFREEFSQAVLENDDELVFAVLERLLDSGMPVFRRYWEESEPESGVDLVYFWEERYWFSSLEVELAGPYASLEEALQAHGLLQWRAGLREVDCEEWSLAETLARLQGVIPPGHRIEVAGECFDATEGGALRPAAA
jgi:hypothetical protein